MTPEFLEGPIARDHREILEAAAVYEAATRKKPATGPKGCNVQTGGPSCKSDDRCNVPTGGPTCKSDRKACKKAHAFHPSVPAWSQPPAPPVA